MTDVLRGRASDVDRGHDNTIVSQRQGGAAHIVNQIATFRVDQKPVTFKSRILVSIKDGDEIVAAGKLKNGTLEALAVRNISTGALYTHSLVMPIVLTSLLALLGLMSLSIGLGYVILPIAGFFGWRIWLVMQAKTAVTQ